MPIAWFLPLTQCYCISVLQKTHPTNLSVNLLLFHCPSLLPCFRSTLASWSLASTTIECPLKHTTHLSQCTSACSRHAPTMFPLALKFEWFPSQRILVLLCFAINIAYLHAPVVFPLALWFQHFRLALQFECFPPQRFFILLPFLTLHHCSSPHTCHVSTCTLISMFPNCTSIWIFSTSMILCLVTLCHCSLPYTLYSTCTSISTFPTCTSI